MTYHHSHAALGLSEAGTQTTLSRGAEVELLQRRLIASRDLAPTVTDGVISSNSSPTLAAAKASAQAMGLSAALVTRTSTGGITLPTQLYRTIVGTAPDVTSSLLQQTTPPEGETFSKLPPSVNDIVKMDRIAAQEAEAAGGGGSSTGIWIATAAGLVAVGGLAWIAMSRSKPKSRQSVPPTRAGTTMGTAATLAANRRRRRRR